ncbi:peptidoglycan-binding domain-containing protein [Streptomyces cinnamoneus]|uniref:peptidoglycan-binding domain-containing protein n=1 Tax=Streptomyces cinnamoneus TaxID=53446 RepID=UPI0033E124AE
MNVRKRIAAGIVSAAFVGGTVAAIAPAAQAAEPATQESASVSATAAGCGWNNSYGWYCGFHSGRPYSDYGDRGPKVKEIQALINFWDGTNLKVDGEFGDKTRSAVKAFQRNHPSAGNADGIVGDKTWKVLRGK